MTVIKYVALFDPQQMSNNLKLGSIKVFPRETKWYKENESTGKMPTKTSKTSSMYLEQISIQNPSVIGEKWNLRAISVITEKCKGIVILKR